MDEYKDGLYEKVISQRLGRKLQQALDNQEIWATISDRVDPQEAVGYLSDYIRKLVHLCLKDLADQNGDSLLEQELALTNGLVGYLTEKAPALAADSQVDRRFPAAGTSAPAEPSERNPSSPPGHFPVPFISFYQQPERCIHGVGTPARYCLQ